MGDEITGLKCEENFITCEISVLGVLARPNRCALGAETYNYDYSIQLIILIVGFHIASRYQMCQTYL